MVGVKVIYCLLVMCIEIEFIRLFLAHLHRKSPLRIEVITVQISLKDNIKPACSPQLHLHKARTEEIINF